MPLLFPLCTDNQLPFLVTQFIFFSQETKPKFEVTADFNRLSLMFMRLDETSGIKTARKVSTATMSCARVQASVGKDMGPPCILTKYRHCRLLQLAVVSLFPVVQN